MVHPHIRVTLNKLTKCLKCRIKPRIKRRMEISRPYSYLSTYLLKQMFNSTFITFSLISIRPHIQSSPVTKELTFKSGERKIKRQAKQNVKRTERSIWTTQFYYFIIFCNRRLFDLKINTLRNPTTEFVEKNVKIQTRCIIFVKFCSSFSINKTEWRIS